VRLGGPSKGFATKPAPSIHSGDGLRQYREVVAPAFRHCEALGLDWPLAIIGAWRPEIERPHRRGIPHAVALGRKGAQARLARVNAEWRVKTKDTP
jgi:hypothetical protein